MGGQLEVLGARRERGGLGRGRRGSAAAAGRRRRRRCRPGGSAARRPPGAVRRGPRCGDRDTCQTPRQRSPRRGRPRRYRRPRASSSVPARIAPLASWISPTSARVKTDVSAAGRCAAGRYEQAVTGAVLPCHERMRSQQRAAPVDDPGVERPRRPRRGCRTRTRRPAAGPRQFAPRRLRRGSGRARWRPGAARIPAVMCAPSNAGPDAVEQLHSSPSCARLISVLVPMSSASVHRVALADTAGEQHRDVIGPDIARRSAAGCTARAPAASGKAELGGADVERRRLGRDVGRLAELADRQPGEQVMHRRVADDNAVDDRGRRGAGLSAQIARQAARAARRQPSAASAVAPALGVWRRRSG